MEAKMLFTHRINRSIIVMIRRFANNTDKQGQSVEKFNTLTKWREGSICNNIKERTSDLKYAQWHVCSLNSMRNKERII
mgnify:CR=1 FL=1